MVISFLNQKGGTGKTTLSINVASEFVRRNKNVLLIDADPQGSALDWSSSRTIDSLVTVVSYPRPTLHRDITKIGVGHDVIVVDGPPRVTDLARTVILASDIVLIPVQPSPYDVWASAEVVKLLEESMVFKEKLVCCFVINRKIVNTAIGTDVRHALAAYSFATLNTSVSQRVIFAEAATKGLAVFEVDDSSQATKEIEKLISEMEKKEQIDEERSSIHQS